MRTQTPLGLPESINPTWRIAIVASSFYKELMESMVDGAVKVLKKAGCAKITVHWTAGSFEVPLIGEAILQAKKADALIGLGIIVDGETHHARLLADQAARGIMDVQLRYAVPFAFELLSVKTLEDARERATGDANKGGEAARAVLHSLAQLAALRSDGIV